MHLETSSMKELSNLAYITKTKLGINYNNDGVKCIEGFIERTKSYFPKDQWEELSYSCGAFLGQCIIENYGGKWSQDENGQFCIEFNEHNKVYPFSKVSKQFENGLEDSIHSLYIAIPTVFNLQPMKKKKWWNFH